MYVYVPTVGLYWPRPSIAWTDCRRPSYARSVYFIESIRYACLLYIYIYYYVTPLDI